MRRLGEDLHAETQHVHDLGGIVTRTARIEKACEACSRAGPPEKGHLIGAFRGTIGPKIVGQVDDNIVELV